MKRKKAVGTKPAKKKLTPAQLFKKHSQSAKIGWITKKAIKKNRSLQAKIKTGSKVEIARLKRELGEMQRKQMELQTENIRIRKDFEIESREATKKIETLDERLRRLDPLEERQLEFFGKENYKRLRDADNFFAMADKIAQEMEISTKEVFSNWMSPH